MRTIMEPMDVNEASAGSIDRSLSEPSRRGKKARQALRAAQLGPDHGGQGTLVIQCQSIYTLS